jgi:hypothetical protein
MAGVSINVKAKMDKLAEQGLLNKLDAIKNNITYKSKYWLLVVALHLNQSNDLNAFDLTIVPEFKLAIPFTSRGNLDEYMTNNRELLMGEEFIIIEN